MAEEAELREAAKNGDVSLVNKHLSAGVKQTSDEDGDTPLLLATACYISEPKYEEVVRALLGTGGSQINHKNVHGDAAIHNAASKGHLEIMELLLESGADVGLEGEDGMVPLGLAATKKHLAVVNVLVKKLVEENEISEEQVEWAAKPESENQQLDIYRALNCIFNEKSALKAFIQADIISKILQGMKKFNKISICSSGLQLLHVCIQEEGGLKAMKRMGLKDKLNDVCKVYEADTVVQHLLNEVVGKL